MPNVTVHTAADVMEYGLTLKIREELCDRIMKRLLSDFAEQAKPVVKAEVEKLVLGRVEHLKQVHDMYSTLRVEFGWK